MDDSLEALRNYAKEISDGKRDLKSLGATVLHYGMFIRQTLNTKRPDFLNQREINLPTQSGSGLAITPWRAAACLEDLARTAAFVRGSIQAVEHKLAQCAHRPLHLVEAGCGPLGTLILPLLARFNRDELVVSLIDLHKESIACIKLMLEHFGFLPRVNQLIYDNATTIVLDSPVDLVLTETMNVVLSKEPQVEITRALMQQHPSASLIPQSIRIDCCLADLKTEISHFPHRVGERPFLATVFELNRKTALELVEENGLLPAAQVLIPHSIKPGFAPCLTTTIQVFEETQARDYDSQITMPFQLPPLTPGALLQFAYRMGKYPGLIFQLIDTHTRAN